MPPQFQPAQQIKDTRRAGGTGRRGHIKRKKQNFHRTLRHYYGGSANALTGKLPGDQAARALRRSPFFICTRALDQMPHIQRIRMVNQSYHVNDGLSCQGQVGIERGALPENDHLARQDLL